MSISNSEEFGQGYDIGWRCFWEEDDAIEPSECNDDFNLGWWCGYGDASAYHEGRYAHYKGIKHCPYLIGADDECFRTVWLDGYWDAAKRVEDYAKH